MRQDSRTGQRFDFGKNLGQIIGDNRARLQFFQERLEYEADKGARFSIFRSTTPNF